MDRSFLLATLASVPLSLFSQTSSIQMGSVADIGTTDQGDLRPRLAINAANEPVVIWGRLSPAANFVAVGNGGTFSTPVLLQPMGVQPSVADWMGSSIAANGDNVWAVFKGLPEDVTPCYVVSSTDGGYTWGDTMRVDPYDGLVSRFPSIAMHGDEPIVQYMQFNSGFAGARQVVTHMMGSAFMAPVQISSPFAPGDVCDCCPGQVVVDGARVAALYRNAGSNIRVIWGGASSDGGSSFPAGAVLDNTNWFYPSCPSTGPDGYYAGDSIRYVWMSGEENGSKVYLGTASATDLSMGAQMNVHGGQAQSLQQNFPRIAGSGDTLGVVWQQANAGQYEILFSWSTTGIAGMSAPDTVNADVAGAQKTPDIAYANGAFHIVWSDVAAGVVRYRKATVSSNTGTPEVNAAEVPFIWPDPVQDHLNVRVSLTGSSVITIQDQLGRTVWNGTGIISSVDVSALAEGYYHLSVRDGVGRTSARVPFVIAR